MKTILLLFYLLSTAALTAQTVPVAVEKQEDGWRLMTGDEPFMVNGMNWDYFPIGTNYTYNLWDKPDDFIKKALDDEMALLQNIGVNAIRVYTGIQPKWISYIHENYGIYTMLNHAFGRYGLMLDGSWEGNTNYADPRVIELLMNEVEALAEEFKDTPGLLLYLLGNENNYGLFWGGAETEDIPKVDDQYESRARDMYRLFNKAALAMKTIDPEHPVAICNGDLLFLDIIADECRDVDIFGINVYRGASFNDLFERVKNEYGKPVLLTELGADAYNDSTQQEDPCAQAWYLRENWREIYQNAAGMGSSNVIGGFTFQSSDGWWKHGQTFNLDVHDTHASWSNGGYLHDYSDGRNNMNEEWFGISAKGQTDANGHYPLFPRAAYYVLKEAHSLNPYAEGNSSETILRYFNSISIRKALIRAGGEKAADCFIGNIKLE